MEGIKICDFGTYELDSYIEQGKRVLELQANEEGLKKLQEHARYSHSQDYF